MTKKYPEVHSLKESLAILDKYKHEISKEQQGQLKSVVGNHAIKNMFLNEKDIIDCIKILKGETTVDKEILMLKKVWGVL